MTKRDDGGAMPMTIEKAREVLQDTHECAFAWEPGARLLGNVRAMEMAQALTTMLAHAKERDEAAYSAYRAARTALGGTP